MQKGLILSGVGYIPRTRASCNLTTAHIIVRSLIEDTLMTLRPRYAYCVNNGSTWDSLWGEVLISLGVPYTLVSPFYASGTGHHYIEDQQCIDRHRAHAQSIVHIQENYSEDVYERRDKYIVDNSEGIVCLLQPDVTTGTAHRVSQLANQSQLPILQLWHEYIALLAAPH